MVLHVDKKRAEAWSDEEVVERWKQLYKGDVLVDKWLQNKEALSAPQLKVIGQIVEKWRVRLYSLEWFTIAFPAIRPSGHHKWRSKMFPTFLFLWNERNHSSYG